MYFIYKIANKLTGKAYVGFTTTTIGLRWTRHKAKARAGSRTHFHNAIRKYGADSFEITILEEGTDVKLGLTVSEPAWISRLCPEYNHTKGGEGLLGWVPTREQKESMSQRAIGNQHAKGIKQSEEWKSKRSMVLMGRPNSNSGKCIPTQRIVECPHCKKKGGHGGMALWHFNKCKEKLYDSYRQ